MALGHEEDAILSMDGSGSLAELVIAVHEQLKGKRYLMVFDDVWHVDDWYADVVGAGGRNAPRRADDWSERLAFGLPKERGCRDDGGEELSAPCAAIAQQRELLGNFHGRPLPGERDGRSRYR